MKPFNVLLKKLRILFSGYYSIASELFNIKINEMHFVFDTNGNLDGILNWILTWRMRIQNCTTKFEDELIFGAMVHWIDRYTAYNRLL